MPDADDGISALVPDVSDGSDPRPSGIDYDALERQRVLGVGGNATTYAAEHPDGTGLALKEPHVDSPVPQSLVERFEREATAWRRVDDHPNIVTVYDAGTSPRPWLALELVEGGSLRDRDPGVDEALWMGVRLADALAGAHEAGVAHLDVTPTNVLVRETVGDAWSVPAVTDWGVAALLEEHAATLEGCSPRYAAPEQFSPDRFGDPGTHTDVYQLGVVLYELLTGELPFTGPPAVLREAILEETPAPATGVDPTLPAALDGVLARALAKAPADRYGSAAAFGAALADVLESETGYAPDLPARDADAGTVTAQPGTGTFARAYDRALTLESQGFVRLTDGYFARREPAPPLEAWRRGLDLVDVRAGRAVARQADEGDLEGTPTEAEAEADAESMATALVDALRTGTDCAVLGPPGSGKSTVCKRVACEWFDAGHGPVFYRESGGSSFDRPAAVARELARVDGHALIVVEDAVRPGGQAVFELLDRVGDVDDVAVLVDARESEWREARGGTHSLGNAPRSGTRDRLATVHVPRPDAETFERFVEAAEAAIDRSLDVDIDRLHRELRRTGAAASEDGPQPGELFYLIHRLTALARDPMAEAPTTLTEAVGQVYDDLAGAGERALDVGVAVNLLNAAGIGVYPELVYAVAPDDPVVVDDAIDVLDGRIVFPREADWTEGAEPYPAVHEAWSTEFLARLLESAGTEAARDRFGRVVTLLLALADDPALRERVSAVLHTDAPYLERVAADPAEWAEATVERVFDLGRTASNLAPLYGETESSSIELPESCSAWTGIQQAYWRGVTYRTHGDLDRAEREFSLFRDRVESGTVEDGIPAPASFGETEDEGGELDRAENRRKAWLARARTELGIVARERGDLETAESHLEESLALCRELGDTGHETTVMKELGGVAYQRGNYDTARDRYDEVLKLCREIGDRHREAFALHNIGVIAHHRGEFATAHEYYEESLSLCRAVGDRHNEAQALQSLGTVARERGKLERASKRLTESLSLSREVGDRKTEVLVLNELGTVARDRGELSTATDYLQESLSLSREIGNQQTEALALAYLGSVAIEREELETAVEYLEESLELCREIGDAQGEGEALQELGIVARERGELNRARTRFAEAAELFMSIGAGDTAAALRKVIDVCERQGDVEAAVEWCQRAIEFAQETDRPDVRFQFATLKADLTDSDS